MVKVERIYTNIFFFFFFMKNYLLNIYAFERKVKILINIFNYRKKTKEKVENFKCKKQIMNIKTNNKHVYFLNRHYTKLLNNF